MKKHLIIGFVAMAIILNSCTNGQTQNTATSLTVNEFSEKIKTVPNSVIIDVRTPEEFSEGHLQNAVNYDWNGSDFEQQVSTLDKQQPVFVYCLSGGRSGSAANKMRKMGFTQVIEMQGGMMKWRSVGLPETTSSTTISLGMTKQQFDELLNGDKLILVDFYAEWCAPCKKMKPYLDEISKEYTANVVVTRIDADENRNLCKELKIESLPVLQLYKNKKLVWSHEGYIEKSEVVKQLK
jgi:thioredoxin